MKDNKPTLIDSHCHLDLLDFTKLGVDLDQVLKAAREKGVVRFLNVSVDEATLPQVIATAQRYDDVYASVGIHPSESADAIFNEEFLHEQALNKKVVAIGETGLDYHYHPESANKQQRSFVQHIELAKAVKKPLIIHTRDAREDTIRILKAENAQAVGGVMHCFTENWAMAKAALDLGFYISFSGIVTFKNAKSLVEVAEQVPLDRLLIETDSPFLTPMPYRGKPNTPEYVYYVAQKIADIKQCDLFEVAERTTQNYHDCFGA